MASKRTRADKAACYAVPLGKRPGVYASWTRAMAQVEGCAVPLVRACKSTAEALEFVNTFQVPEGRVLHVVYCDGACTGNGKAHARGGVGVFWGHDDPRNVSRPVRGKPTNNVAELEAIEDVLDEIATKMDDSAHYVVVTDSSYSKNALSCWHDSWKAKGWRKSDGTTPSNLDLIRQIRAKWDALPNVRIAHVRGHHGIEGNERADALAVAGIAAAAEEPPAGDDEPAGEGPV